MKRLPVLCPQAYEGITMLAVPCSRCADGWDRASMSCKIPTGIEHLPLVSNPPDCPIANRCQHQRQLLEPCPVRARGMVCESALRLAGDPRAESSGFNAYVVASPEEVATWND